MHLKNGSVIRGEIIEKRSDSSIRIQTENRNIFVYKEDEISTIGEIVEENNRRGFISILEISYAAGTGQTHTFQDQLFFNADHVVSLRTINGYEFNDYFSLGIGVGIDKYQHFELLPLTVNFRAALSDKKITPFVEFNIGNSFKISNQEPGFLFNPAIGLRSYISPKTALIFSFGYKMQETKFTHRTFGLDPRIGISNHRLFKVPASLQFFTFNVGFSF